MVFVVSAGVDVYNEHDSLLYHQRLYTNPIHSMNPSILPTSSSEANRFESAMAQAQLKIQENNVKSILQQSNLISTKSYVTCY